MLSRVIIITLCGTILYVCRLMLRIVWLNLLAAFATLAPVCGYAQAATPAPPVTTQSQVWYGYYITADFGKKWFLTMEVENRQFIKPVAQNLFFMRPHLHYKVHKHWDVAAGFAYFLVTTQNPQAPKSSLTTPELRPFQEANNSFSWGRLTLTNRLRFEQRWVQKTIGQQLDEGYNFNLRFRYRIALDVLLYQTKAEKHKVKLRVNDEIMANIPTKLVKNAFDQNRVYAGINYQPPGPVSFEVGYLHWYQERQMTKQYFNRHVLRFSVFHKVAWPAKQKVKPKLD